MKIPRSNSPDFFIGVWAVSDCTCATRKIPWNLVCIHSPGQTVWRFLPGGMLLRQSTLDGETKRFLYRYDPKEKRLYINWSKIPEKGPVEIRMDDIYERIV